MARITGRDRMRKVLKAIPIEMRKRLREAILAGAEDMANTMRTLAPVHTGKLRDEINVSAGDERPDLYDKLRGQRTERDPELAAIIHVDDWKAAWVEFGTAPHINKGEFAGTQNPGTPAQPFFFPGYRARKKQVQARINKAARQAIKDGLR